MIKELNSICRIAFLGVSVFAQSLTTFGRDCPDAVNWCDVSAYWENPAESKMTYVDLFCGAGGLSKGLEMAGFRGVGCLDWFDAAERTFRRNFKTPYINGDVTKADVKSNLYAIVRKELGGSRLSLLVGGFPYQGFSMAGKGSCLPELHQDRR